MRARIRELSLLDTNIVLSVRPPQGGDFRQIPGNCQKSRQMRLKRWWQDCSGVWRNPSLGVRSGRNSHRSHSREQIQRHFIGRGDDFEPPGVGQQSVHRNDSRTS